jgi:gliding motility-associated-like protein
MDIQFTDQSTGDSIFWVWTFGDGDNAWVQNPVHFYSDPGTYTVGLYIEDSTGCKDYFFTQVVVEDELIIPNVFTPNGDGVNDILILKGVREADVFIYDRWGNQIFYNSGNVQDHWNGKTVSGADCPVGVYYVRVAGFSFKGIRINEVVNVTLVR